MHVIGHQDVGMNEAIIVCSGVSQCLAIVCVISVVKKHRLPIHAACNDVLRNIRNEESTLARHRRIVVRRDLRGPLAISG